jgi:hypothetical protein
MASGAGENGYSVCLIQVSDHIDLQNALLNLVPIGSTSTARGFRFWTMKTLFTETHQGLDYQSESRRDIREATQAGSPSWC